jgi:DNA-binding transcriptional ArsR family regulator
MTAATAAPALAPARLLDLDPDLAVGMSPDVAEQARRHVVVPALELPPGPFEMTSVTARGLHAFGVLVASGLLVRDVILRQTVASELLGPGDIAPPDGEPALVPLDVRWSVAEHAEIAILDDRLLPALRAWPELGRALLARSAQRSPRVEAQRAISQLPRVEDRLVALFGMLAERFARMTPCGLVVSVSLTHAMLGRLVGARRPTVSLALKTLAEDGSVMRREDGSWLLSQRALDGLYDEGAERAMPRPEAHLVATPAARPADDHRLRAEERRRTDAQLARARAQSEALRDRVHASLARAAVLRSRSQRSVPAEDGRQVAPSRS